MNTWTSHVKTAHDRFDVFLFIGEWVGLERVSYHIHSINYEFAQNRHSKFFFSEKDTFQRKHFKMGISITISWYARWFQRKSSWSESDKSVLNQRLAFPPINPNAITINIGYDCFVLIRASAKPQSISNTTRNTPAVSTSTKLRQWYTICNKHNIVS